jgi:DNA polymerase-3 subunit epsilon/CBS domain-containing protein
MAAHNASPLIALDALVVDTETTGLDAAKARVVEIGCVPIVGGKVVEARGFRVRINPGEPIPATATCIHGIDDTAVAESPSFASAWPDLQSRLSAAVWIGHTVGYDLAVLKRECARAGIEWRPPRTLDTRLLAQAAAPDLGGYSLEHLAGWLGIDVAARHSALGDAVTTAKIFVALLPKLRDANIRALAEAEQACRGFATALEEYRRAGWESPVAEAPQRSVDSMSCIDVYPYRHRVAGVMSAPPRFVAATTALSDVLRIMNDEKISSLFVTSRDGALRIGDAAIVTERDVLRALAGQGAGALARPVSAFASSPLVSVPADSFVYRALGRMAGRKLRHLAVTDEDGNVVGIVSARDLLRLRAQDATIIGDGIDQADTVQQLALEWAKLPRAAAGLLAEGVSGRDIAAVISRELAALTRRAAVLAERAMGAAGKGPPPCAYSFCVLGSAGRGESLLAMDQDNALVFAEGEAGGEEDRWFAELGAIVADTLHEVGVPYCPGGVMAKNGQWRGSVAAWRARIAEWITRSNPADLLSVDIFFDLAGVHGDLSLANGIWRAAYDAARGNATFAKLLVEAAGQVESGLTFFGGFRSDNGRLDLKRTGLFGIVSVARALAIRHHIVERSTRSRLAGLAALDRGKTDLDALAQAQGTFLDLILAQQLVDIDAGKPPVNKVEIKRLSREERARLKQALEATAHVDTLSQDLLF